MSLNHKFLEECINNRKILELTCADMASYLINVSEKNYVDFENNKYSMSEENLKRICRVLCVKPKKVFKLDDYIDVNGLSEEEYVDLSEVVETIVGDENA